MTGPQKEQRRLAALHALNILDTPPEERFDRITRLTQRTFGVPIAVIALVDDKRAWFKSRMGLAEPELPRDGSFCEETLRAGGTMVVPDAAKDPRFSAHPLVASGPRIRFYAGHPLCGRDGAVVGTLSVLDPLPRDLDNEQRRALRDLAGLVEEQLAASPQAVAPADEHTRLLARLRLSTEHAAARRRARAVFLALVAVLVLGTAISMRLAQRLVTDTETVELKLGSAAVAAQDLPLARMRSTARFFRSAVGVRGLVAAALLLVVLLIFDRHIDARLAALAAVELDRARLQAVIDAIGDGVVVADARGRFTVFNPAAERILGLGMVGDPEHSGRFYSSFLKADGAPCPPAEHPLTRAIAGETAHAERLLVRNERRPSGLPLTVTATPVRSFDGAPAGGVIVFRDAS